jgi:hypothetical protein
MKPSNVNFDLYERMWRLCGNQQYNELYLADFSIRREKFIQQELDERVNLWMVVTITISGVILAGIQLFMSYRLANAGRAEFAKDSTLAAEQGKISLRSSITGVVILIVSLAFFVVYVKWIYTINELRLEQPVSLQSPQLNLLPQGTLNTGRPPTAERPNSSPADQSKQSPEQ